MTTQILLLLALHVVASLMIAKWKWSKLQEYLSLHRLLDTFSNMISAHTPRQTDSSTHTIKADSSTH